MSPTKKINRRKFLITAGGVIGASVMCCAGAGMAAMQQPAIDYAEGIYGKENTMGKKILIAYATKCGSTGEIAEAMAKVMAQSGLTVDVLRVQQVKNLDGYSGVVIGSAARMNALLPEAVQFAKKYRKLLKKLPTAYFTVGIAMKEDTPENRKTAAGYLQPLVEVQEPAAEPGLFAGMIDHSKMEWLWRSLLSFANEGAMAEGDFRNWPAIEQWASETAKAFA